MVFLLLSLYRNRNFHSIVRRNCKGATLNVYQLILSIITPDSFHRLKQKARRRNKKKGNKLYCIITWQLAKAAASTSQSARCSEARDEISTGLLRSDWLDGDVACLLCRTMTVKPSRVHRESDPHFTNKYKNSQ